MHITVLPLMGLLVMRLVNNDALYLFVVDCCCAYYFLAFRVIIVVVSFHTYIVSLTGS